MALLLSLTLIMSASWLLVGFYCKTAKKTLPQQILKNKIKIPAQSWRDWWISRNMFFLKSSVSVMGGIMGRGWVRPYISLTWNKTNASLCNFLTNKRVCVCVCARRCVSACVCVVCEICFAVYFNHTAKGVPKVFLWVFSMTEASLL